MIRPDATDDNAAGSRPSQALDAAPAAGTADRDAICLPVGNIAPRSRPAEPVAGELGASGHRGSDRAARWPTGRLSTAAAGLTGRQQGPPLIVRLFELRHLVDRCLQRLVRFRRRGDLQLPAMSTRRRLKLATSYRTANCSRGPKTPGNVPPRRQRAGGYQRHVSRRPSGRSFLAGARGAVSRS